MKRSNVGVLAFTALAFVGGALLAPLAATADEVWSVNATFTDGGALTGFLDFNVYGQLGNFDLRTSAVGGFPGFDFRPGHGDIAPAGGGPGTTSIVLYGPTYDTDNLVLNASTSFTTSQPGNVLLASSAECIGAYSCSPGATTRYLSGPSPLGTPEPSAWALMLLGLGRVGAAARRGRRPAIA